MRSQFPVFNAPKDSMFLSAPAWVFLIAFFGLNAQGFAGIVIKSVQVESSVSIGDYEVRDAQNYAELTEFVAGDLIAENNEAFARSLYLISQNEAGTFLNSRNVHSIYQGLDLDNTVSTTSSSISFESDELFMLGIHSEMGYWLGDLDADARLFVELTIHDQFSLSYFIDNHLSDPPGETIGIRDTMMLPPGQYLLRTGSMLSGIPSTLNADAVAGVSVSITAVPEPSTLLMAAVVGVFALRKSAVRN